MKSMFKTIGVILASILFSTAVVAAPLDWNYVTAGGVNIKLDAPDLVSFEQAGTPANRTIKIVRAENKEVNGVTVNTYEEEYSDLNSVTFNKIVAKAGLANYFFKVGTSNRYMSGFSPINGYCSGSVTLWTYGNGAIATLSDGCAVNTARNAVSN